MIRIRAMSFFMLKSFALLFLKVETNFQIKGVCWGVVDSMDPSGYSSPDLLSHLLEVFPQFCLIPGPMDLRGPEIPSGLIRLPLTQVLHHLLGDARRIRRSPIQP